MGNTRYFL